VVNLFRRKYTTDAGGSPLGTSASGANFSVTPVITTLYYAESLYVAGCSSPARTTVTVTVNPIPTITSTSPGSVCTKHYAFIPDSHIFPLLALV